MYAAMSNTLGKISIVTDMYVCMYACVYVCMNVCMHVCMHVLCRLLHVDCSKGRNMASMQLYI